MGEQINSTVDWFSWKWFLWAKLQIFDWENPAYFYGFLVLPLLMLLWWLLSFRKGRTLAIAFTKKDIRRSPYALLRHVPSVCLLTCIALLIVSLARPQKNNEKIEQWTEGIDIMLVLDISESMKLEDFRPNRLEAAKDVAREFIAGRFQDRIGLVIFSGEAYSKAPLTTDYDLLRSYVNEIDFGTIAQGNTAIGSALAVATNRMRESDSTSKVIILLSDGENTAGNIDPITAAELAAAYRIKIYTIAIGKQGKVPFGKDFFGNTRYVENNLDETTLRKIAKIGKGEFYRVSNNQALEEVFARIDQYEKAEIKENRFKDTTDYYPVYLKWAILFFLIWLLLKATFMSNILQD